MYILNQAFNLDSDIVAQGLQFIVKDSNNIIIWQTTTYTSQGGMGIVQLQIPNSNFRGSVWVVSQTDNNPIDVIAINPPDLGEVSDNISYCELYLWLITPRGIPATNYMAAFLPNEENNSVLQVVPKVIGASGYATFHLIKNKNYILNIYDLEGNMIKSQATYLAVEKNFLAISI